MPESAARTHMNRAAEALEGHGASISPAEKVLIYLGLAQVEATLEMVELLKGGIVLHQAEELAQALQQLATRLPAR